MVATSFEISGHFSSVALEDGRTVNSESLLLPRSLQNIREKCPRGRITLHQHNPCTQQMGIRMSKIWK